MNILYVTDTWHGFYEALYDGATTINGLPSYGRVLEKLIENGNNVDFILISNDTENKPLNIGLSWIKKEQILGVINYRQSSKSKAVAISKLISTSFAAVKNKNYDFIYAHGLVAGFSIYAAKHKKIPFGQRLYGTFLWDEYQKNPNILSNLSLFRSYYNIIAYRYKKAFLLITNDGSRGDLVYQKVCKDKSKFEFLYWVNGVKRLSIDKSDLITASTKYNIREPFIFYPARFDSWKQQDRILRVIKLLKDDGIFIHCYFAGAKTVESYYNDIIRMTKELEIEDRVHFLGNLSYTDIASLHKLATTSLALYTVCNFTNVFHEMLANGAVSIVRSDGVVDDVIINGENGFLVGADNNDVVSIIKRLLKSPEEAEEIRRRAVQTSYEYIQTWDQRIEDEIALIKKHAKKDGKRPL